MEANVGWREEGNIIISLSSRRNIHLDLIRFQKYEKGAAKANLQNLWTVAYQLEQDPGLLTKRTTKRKTTDFPNPPKPPRSLYSVYLKGKGVDEPKEPFRNLNDEQMAVVKKAYTIAQEKYEDELIEYQKKYPDYHPRKRHVSGVDDESPAKRVWVPLLSICSFLFCCGCFGVMSSY